MLVVGVDSMPGSQSAAINMMSQSSASGQLISSKALAVLVGKAQNTPFDKLVEVLSVVPESEELNWVSMSSCGTLLADLRDVTANTLSAFSAFSILDPEPMPAPAPMRGTPASGSGSDQRAIYIYKA
jgi:hypothetical protein